MSKPRVFFVAFVVFCLGAMGGVWAQAFLMPYFAAHEPYKNWRFVEEWTQRMLVVRPTTQFFLTENEGRERLVQEMEETVVVVQSTSGSRVLTGSGLVVTSDGLIVTLASLAPAGHSVSVSFEAGNSEKAEVLKRDPKNNLALLKIDKRNLKTAGLATDVSLGESLILLAKDPGEQKAYVNEGLVKTLSGGVLETSITENAFVSGAPLFNRRGGIAGLSSVDSQTLQVKAVPVAVLRSFLGF